MFVNHTKKYIFIRVPKTAGTSMSYHLFTNTMNDDVTMTEMHAKFIENFFFENPSRKKNIRMDIVHERPHHMFINDYQVTSKMLSNKPLEDYTVYGVVRHPVHRFISAVAHHVFEMGISNAHSLKTDYLVRRTLSDKDLIKGIIYRPQTDWLLDNGRIDNIIAFEDINKFALDITGAPLTAKLRSEDRGDRDNTLSKDLENDILELYHRDFELYEKIRNHQ